METVDRTAESPDQAHPVPRTESRRGLRHPLALHGLLLALFLINIAIRLSVMEVYETDVWGYFRGAERLRQGLPLYSTQLDLVNDNLQFIYPPLLAQLVYPFRSLTMLWWLWAAFTLAAFAGVLALLRPYAAQFRALPTRWQLYGTGGLLLFPPLMYHFTWGQVQLQLLCLITACWYALGKRRDVLAGICLGVAIALKLYPAVLLGPLLLHRRWRAAGSAMLSAAALLAVSFAAIGWEQAKTFFLTILPTVSEQLGGDAIFSHSARMNLQLWISNRALAEVLALMFQAAVLVLFVTAAWRYREATRELILMSLSVIILISPVVWEHYFVLLLVPWISLFMESRGRLWRPLGLIYGMTATAPFIRFMPDGLLMYLIHELPFLGTVLLFGLQYRWLRQKHADLAAESAALRVGSH